MTRVKYISTQVQRFNVTKDFILVEAGIEWNLLKSFQMLVPQLDAGMLPVSLTVWFDIVSGMGMETNSALRHIVRGDFKLVLPLDQLFKLSPKAGVLGTRGTPPSGNACDLRVGQFFRGLGIPRAHDNISGDLSFPPHFPLRANE